MRFSIIIAFCKILLQYWFTSVAILIKLITFFTTLAITCFIVISTFLIISFNTNTLTVYILILFTSWTRMIYYTIIIGSYNITILAFSTLSIFELTTMFWNFDRDTRLRRIRKSC